jgi:hypothetical protein
MNHIRNRLARFAVAGVLAVGLASSAGVAFAAGNSAGNGGALNMLHDPTMGTVPMVQDEKNFHGTSAYGSYGNAGMFCAVFITNDLSTPGACNGHQ